MYVKTAAFLIFRHIQTKSPHKKTLDFEIRLTQVLILGLQSSYRRAENQAGRFLKGCLMCKKRNIS